MQLKGIALCPVSAAPERTYKDLALETARLKPDTIVLVVPQGHVFVDALSADYVTAFKTQGATYACDMGILDDANRIFAREDVPAVFLNPDKAAAFGAETALAPAALPFLEALKKVCPDFKLVQITAAPLAPATLLEAGRSLREACETAGHSAVLIAFCDVYTDSAAQAHDPDFSAAALSALESGDFLPLLALSPQLTENPQYDALIVAAGASEQLKTHAQFFGSGAVGAFLSFAVLSGEKDFSAPSLIDAWAAQAREMRRALRAGESDIIRLARAAAALWVNDGQRLDYAQYAAEHIKDPDTAARLVNQKTGVFVTVLKDGRPRGSMGTVTPATQDIAHEIITNVIEAVAFDPQYKPVAPDELDALDFEIDVLNPPETVYDISELDPKRYGLIAEQGLKRGVVLPDIYGIDTPEQQIAYAKVRADIDAVTDALDPLVLSRFTTDRF